MNTWAAVKIAVVETNLGKGNGKIFFYFLHALILLNCAYLLLYILIVAPPRTVEIVPESINTT